MTRTISALAAALLVATSAGAFAAPTSTAAPSPSPNTPKQQASLSTKHQMSARRVEEIQAALQSQGETLSVDGIWGSHTMSAMRDFQKKNGLKQTGRYDQATMHNLNIPHWS